MKSILLLTLAAVCALGLTACKKNADGSTSVDTAAVEKAFASAEPALKETVNTAVAAIKSADYQGALGKLNTALSDAKITPEQKTAVQSLIEQVKKLAMEKLAKPAADAANKAGDAIKNALPK
ncbi:MAG: hypothetical protein HY301_16620 [Verrucomicrobia bacterium]|nr:hypothetical protein [Verrucomicrobiota bacterium]